MSDNKTIMRVGNTRRRYGNRAREARKGQGRRETACEAVARAWETVALEKGV